MAEFRALPPEYLVSDFIRPLTSDQKVIMTHLSAGIHSIGLTETGIYPIGRGSLADYLALPESIVMEAFDVFSKKCAPIFSFQEKSNDHLHYVYLKDFFSNQITFGFLKNSLSIVTAVHKDFKRYSSKCPEFFAEFALIHDIILKRAISTISKKDNNFRSYQRTFEELFEMKNWFSDKDTKNKPFENKKSLLQKLENEMGLSNSY